MPIVWELPDGSIQLTQLAEEYLERERREGEDTATAVARLAETVRTPALAKATMSLVKTANVPKDRAHRSKWSKADDRIVVAS